MSHILINPNNPCPQEILEQITPVEVEYIGFDNQYHKGIIEVNKRVVDDIEEFFNKARDLHFPIEKVVRSSDSEYAWDDNKLTAANASSGFNYRLIEGTSQVSFHAQGLAIDINTRVNPYIRYQDEAVVIVDPPGAIYDPASTGALYAQHPLVKLMKRRGWEWGGDWTKDSGRIDYQHFQKNIR